MATLALPVRLPRHPLQHPTRHSVVALGSEVKDSIPGEIRPKQTLVSSYDTTHLVGILKPSQTLHNYMRCLKGFDSFNAHSKRAYLNFNICTLVENNNYYCIIQFITKCRDFIWISYFVNLHLSKMHVKNTII